MAKYAGEHIRCIVTGQTGAEYHHLKSQKAWPQHKEKVWNKLPVCHSIHVEIHQLGLVRASAEYPAIQMFLLRHGWEFDEMLGRWIHPIDFGPEN